MFKKLILITLINDYCVHFGLAEFVLLKGDPNAYDVSLCKNILIIYWKMVSIVN